ncbi:hypothetical protein HAX54_021502 [Datura stramonium]|uniref:Uncharacterized protein n=1 Tax=Datura stramonium TaxID=4076 RepID=A0ABS8Y7A7_DATST|nr:hypothetical protein [Datura stramonium]
MSTQLLVKGEKVDFEKEGASCRFISKISFAFLLKALVREGGKTLAEFPNSIEFGKLDPVKIRTTMSTQLLVKGEKVDFEKEGASCRFISKISFAFLLKALVRMETLIRQATIEAYNFPGVKKDIESKADMLAHWLDRAVCTFANSSARKGSLKEGIL